MAFAPVLLNIVLRCVNFIYVFLKKLMKNFVYSVNFAIFAAKIA